MRYYFTLAAIILSLQIPQFQPAEAPEKHVITGEAQGTTYQLTYYSGKKLISKNDVDSIFTAIDLSLSIYKPESLISRFNQASHGIVIDKKLRTVVQEAQEISVATNGVSDITVLPLVNAWGFGPVKAGSVPDSSRVAELRSCVGYRLISFKADSLIKMKPCVSIDVNGIAQGYSVDLLAEWLEQHGIINYMVELGGEIRVKGRKPGGELMTVGIQAPGSDFDPEGNIKVVPMEQGSITTSGNYRKFITRGGKTFAHLIDPVTGYPFSNELISVTVKAPDTITADGYDNALMGMGLRKALMFLSGHPELSAYFIYKDEHGAIRDTATAGF